MLNNLSFLPHLPSEHEHAATLRGTHRIRTKRETDAKIMKAALHIATTQGIGAVTIEEVARKSKVAKTTIYRRFHNTNELLEALTMLTYVRSEDIPDDCEPTHENFLHMLAAMETRFREGLGVNAIGMMISGDNDVFHQLVREGVLPIEKVWAHFIQRGINAGIFLPSTDAHMVFSTLLGSLIACETLDSHLYDATPIPWAERIALLIWPALTGQK